MIEGTETRSVEVVIDTGAGTSIIDEQLYYKLCEDDSIYKRINTKAMPQLIGPTKERIPVIGRVAININLGGVSIPVKLWVAEGLGREILIGNDVLHSWEAHINYQNQTIKLNKYCCQLYFGETSGEIKNILLAEDEYYIPPRSSIYIKSKISGNERIKDSAYGFISAINQNLFIIPHGIIENKKGKFSYILVTNPFEFQVRIRSGMPLAIIDWDCSNICQIHAQSELGDVTEVYKMKISNSEKYIEEWEGPYKIIDVDDSMASDEESDVEDKYIISRSHVCLVGEKLDFDIGQGLDQAESTILTQMLSNYKELFSEDISSVQLNAEHRIITKEIHPIKIPRRRYSPLENSIIRSEVQSLLTSGCIRPSRSEWSAPVVLVKKKDGTPRFCIDYRQLNNATIKEVYPIPRIDETLDSLASMRYFTTLDFTTGYWKIPIREEDKKKTAFETSDGAFEWNRMPMGLCNAPYTFQRFMDIIMKSMKWTKCLVYLDDIIVFSRTFGEHLTDVEDALKLIKHAGMKLKLKKCKFAYEKVLYLGHIISKEGIEVDPEKINAINTIKELRSVAEVKSFLGLCSYYRKFINQFSIIARPLYKLLEKNSQFEWGKESEKAFIYLKERLCSTPILKFPDFNIPFILACDACEDGFGAVLSQKGAEGREHVIGYYSKTTTKAEKNYNIRDLECTAVYKAVRYFRPYLYGQKFEIQTA